MIMAVFSSLINNEGCVGNEGCKKRTIIGSNGFVKKAVNLVVDWSDCKQ
jgi:hypothetical protein